MSGLSQWRFLKNRQVWWQFSRFFVSGTISAVVDLSVLNLLTFWFYSAERSFYFIFFKMISFAVAVTCSYLLNKHFVFRQNGKAADARLKIEGKKFLLVSLGGLVINVTAASLAFFVLINFPRLQDLLLLITTMSSLFGSFTGMFWNFLGYKLLVFRK